MQPKTNGGAETKAKSGMLPVLSMADYHVDQRLIDEALGGKESQDRDPMSRFEQPKFGS
jgi:hypothetical protein